jgi:hypothetical protein
MADQVSNPTEQENEQPAHLPKMGWISIVLVCLLAVVDAVIWARHRSPDPETL